MPSFGEDIRRERELRNITLREISEATKISLRYLDALEHNDFRHLPGGVFNKGFVRAYSEFIGVDPEGMVNAYLLEERHQEARVGPKAHPGAGPAAPAVRSSHGGERARVRSGAWTVVSVLLLLVAAGVLAGMFVLWVKRGSTGAGNGPSLPESETTFRPAGRPEAEA